MPTYSGPTERLPFAKPLEMFGYDRGRTVLRVDGEWQEGSDFDWATLAATDVVPQADRPGGMKIDGTDRYCFLGGYVYDISAAVATTLTDAGYGSYVT